ncbi:taste receptor type 2 member 104-like [Anolis sagrei]|uniref:taste receptor type 2 member 104-like n=1 Tax=Anolis sagrei TaxID=38937 RepID=UPI0035214FC9
MDNHLISPLGIFTWTIIGSMSMVAILGNGFIIIVNGNQWLQTRKMAPSDFLLTSLSISRVFWYVTFGLSHLLKFGDAFIYSSAQEVLNFVCIFSGMASLWCASWLSVFYCVKVTNFANRFLLWLKPRINVLSIRLLGMSISSLVVMFIPFFCSYAEEKKRCNLTGSLPVNISQRKACQALYFIFLPFHLIVASMNFIIGITATILLLLSLWKHTRNLKKSGIGAKDLSTQIHINVMKSLVCYIFLYILYFAGMLNLASNVHTAGAMRLLSDILLTTFPSAHTIILVLSNPKLKALLAPESREPAGDALAASPGYRICVR